MVYRQPKTINEIADCLGVSPVYVESEAEFLEEYGFLIKKDNKYLTSFLIDEPNEKIAELHEKMYSKAAQIFANDLYDSLLNSGILKSPGLVCNQSCEYEDNIDFMLWSLIPYIAALSGESLIENRIAFDEVATIRPDGAVNIAYASIEQKNGSKLKYYESIRNWCGPCWNSNSELILWQIDSEWSEKRVGDNYQNSVQRDLALLGRFLKGEPLSMDEYAYLIETSSGSFTFTADSPKAVEVMNFYAELTQLGLIENVEAGDAPNIWYDINIAKSGKSAFWMSWVGMTQTPTFPESSSWGCMYPPKWSKSTNYVSPNTTVKYYSVSAGVSKPAEVLTVMSEMAKPFLTEAERSANRRATVTPPVSDKYSLEAMLTADKIQKFTNTDFANAANILKGENKDGWNYQVAKIASGQMTLAKAVASYKSVYNNRLKKLFG